VRTSPCVRVYSDDRVGGVTDLQELKEHVQHADSGGQSPAQYVLAFIVDFLPDPVVFVDADVPAQLATDPGQVFVVTKSRVVLATFENVVKVGHNNPNSRSSVEVETWGRSDLRRISLEVDPDVGWHNLAGEGEAWPAGAVVTLSYKDNTPVRLPMAKHPPDFHLAKVRSITKVLLADLA